MIVAVYERCNSVQTMAKKRVATNKHLLGACAVSLYTPVTEGTPYDFELEMTKHGLPTGIIRSVRSSKIKKKKKKK